MNESLTNLITEIVAFRDARDWSQFHTPRNLATALSIEAAELQESMLWKTDAEVADLTRDAASITPLRHEAADVLIYALLFCNRLGIDPAQAIRDKLALNAEKYPVDRAKGRADKYTAYEK